MPDIDNKLSRIVKILLIISLVLALLYLGRTLLVPLSFALLIAFILYPICKWLEKRGIGMAPSILLSMGLIFLLLTGLIYLLVWRMFDFFQRWPELSEKVAMSLQNMSDKITEAFDITSAEQITYIKEALQNMASEVPALAQKVIYASSVSIVLFLIIPVYVFLILFYRRSLVNFLYSLFPRQTKAEVNLVIQESIIAYYNFIKGMALVYLIVGVLNSLGLFIIGIQNPVFFGLIASILTFIPYVGILIGAAIPVAIAWISFDSPWYPLSVIGVFTVVQVLEANIIFPLAVGNRLQINTLVSIIVIILGGLVWGAAGMILFLPFAAIFKLIADKVEELRPLSALMSTGH